MKHQVVIAHPSATELDEAEAMESLPEALEHAGPDEVVWQRWVTVWERAC